LATNFSHCFPTSEDPDGVTRSEVPEPMVALVATAVSRGFSNVTYVLYIRENRVGAYHAMIIDIYDKARCVYNI
jgi:hypothetical protein